MNAARKGPLSGITVVDLTRVLAGPYCTMLMAELGARVIKVEPPGKGDDSRQYGPFVNGRPCYFGSVNRDKESIALDLKAPRDREIFERLLEKADVIAENFRPGVMEKLGYGWETLHARYPRLIYVATSGYGHSGPDTQRPAYDMVIQGLSGMMSVTGEPDGGPCRVGISIADVGSGVYSAVAVNAALLHRERTGEATKVDIAMFDCLLAMLESVVSRYVMTGQIGKRLGAMHPAIVPFEAFRTADGHLTVACGNDKLFRLLCETLGRPDLATSPLYETNELRVRNRVALHQEIESVLVGRPTAHWCELFERVGVPAGPINDIAQALAHPQVAARNMLVEAIDPVLGPVKLVGNPLKMSAFEDRKTRRVAPDLDQDRQKILQELGIAE
ncbi:MAG: CoA transferase [Rhodospirillales bacterium]|nr:CoA transferase [Rhodospirillales bacterium]